jgi:hypothetical protein|tara:strand:+ start:329 stop:649 length:321 start_codon:yes stop_codon:yes gene_type:complete
MNRPQKIKEVYRELRMVLGNEYPDHELFKSASLLIEVLSDDTPIPLDQFDKFELKLKDTTVDEATKDGGWKYLSNEGWWDQVSDDQDLLSPQTRAQLKDYGLEVAA